MCSLRAHGMALDSGSWLASWRRARGGPQAPARIFVDVFMKPLILLSACRPPRVGWGWWGDATDCGPELLDFRRAEAKSWYEEAISDTQF